MASVTSAGSVPCLSPVPDLENRYHKRRSLDTRSGQPMLSPIQLPSRLAHMINADLAGKAALVTGAASGIGLATAEAFARNGAAVALNHLPEDPRGVREVERLQAQGWRIIAAPGDVSQPGPAERMVATAIDALGRLDFLVNNAGTPATPTPIPFADLDAL